MKLMVTIDRDEDGVWIVECPSISGCVSQGDTKEEAITNIQEAIELCIEVRAEQGLPLVANDQMGIRFEGEQSFTSQDFGVPE